MTAPGASSLGGLIPVIEEPRPERTPQSELDAWAATLASTLSQQMPPPRALAPPPPAEPWRATVGALTPGSDATPGGPDAARAQSAHAAAGGTEETNHERVHLSTHVAELGEINVVVDRSQAGIRVVIGVEDAHAATLMDPERLRLQGALVAAGVGVDSIRVVQLDRRGTLLASSKGSVTRTSQHQTDAANGDSDPKKRSRGRKVNLVG